MRLLLRSLAWLMLPGLLYAAPDTTMSVTPAAVSGTTITAADENSRNSSIANTFNVHSHTDVTQTGQPLNIGASSGATQIANSTITLEGATADNNEYILSFTDPTADRTVTFPNSSLVASDVVVASAADTLSYVNLGNTNILIGDGTGAPTAASLSGDVTMTNAGAVTISDNSVDGTDIAFGSDAQGDIYYYDGSNVVRLGAGTSGQFLKTQGAGANPTWANLVSVVFSMVSVDQTTASIAQTFTDLKAHSVSGTMKIYKPADNDTMDVWAMTDTADGSATANYRVVIGAVTTSDATSQADNTWNQIANGVDISSAATGWIDFKVQGQNNSGTSNITFIAYAVVLR